MSEVDHSRQFNTEFKNELSYTLIYALLALAGTTYFIPEEYSKY